MNTPDVRLLLISALKCRLTTIVSVKYCCMTANPGIFALCELQNEKKSLTGKCVTD